MTGNLIHMDYSLDSALRESLLAEIKARHLCRLEDDDLYFVNAAGDPARQNKPGDNRLLDGHEEQ